MAGRKPMNRKRYIKAEKAKKRKAKRETEEDMNQNFRIKEVEKKVSSLVKAEKNFLKVASASSLINTLVGLGKNNNMTANNHAVDLNVLTGYNVVSAMTGQSTTWKHIDLAYYINQDPLAETADVGSGTTIRVMVVCIHKPATSSIEGSSPLPTWAEFFADNDADATAMVSSDILRPYNRLNRSNFEVLYDKFHVLVPPQMAVTTAGNLAVGTGNRIATDVVRVQLFPSKRSQIQTYNNLDQASNISYNYVQQNQYWLIYMTDNADNTVAPTISYNVTVDYLM